MFSALKHKFREWKNTETRVGGWSIENALLLRIMHLLKNITVAYGDYVFILTQVCVFSYLSLTNSTIRLDPGFAAISYARH